MNAERESSLGAWGRRLGNASVLIGGAAPVALSGFEVAIALEVVEDRGLSNLNFIIPCIVVGWFAIACASVALFLRGYAPEGFQRRAIVGLLLGALPMILLRLFG